MFIELHMIQNFAPANLNRDDTGNPKDCEFGGVRRARISSQCLKRAIRNEPVFAQITGGNLGIRTRYITRALSKALAPTAKPEQDVAAIVNAVAAAYSSKKGEMDSEDATRTKVALYLSKADVEWVKEEILTHWDELLMTAALASPEEDKSKKGKRAPAKDSALAELVNGLMERTKKHTDAPDIALFGRMLADYPDTNVDAACQVAHAVSTHRVAMEMDFFTAMDEMMNPGETGASMMGFTAYDSACFYRYARLDWEQLVKNLDGDVTLARRAVEGFLRAAVAAVPTGKQNAFAAQNPPAFLLAVVKPQGMAWSLANAFEKPVRPGNDGLTVPSVAALDAYWGRLITVYGAPEGMRVAALALDADLPLTTLKENLVPTLEQWVKTTVEALPAGEA